MIPTDTVKNEVCHATALSGTRDDFDQLFAPHITWDVVTDQSRWQAFRSFDGYNQILDVVGVVAVARHHIPAGRRQGAFAATVNGFQKRISDANLIAHVLDRTLIHIVVR